MLQAMNTGHNGSMTTVHANSASDAITRLEMMVGMSGFKGSSELILKMIGSALDMIVHIGRQSNGHRCVMQICKLTNTANGLQLRELFALDAGGNLARNPSEQNVPLLNDVMPGSP